MAATKDLIETRTAAFRTARRRRTTPRLVSMAMVLGALLFVALAPEPVPQWFAGQDKLHHVAGLLMFGIALRTAAPGLGWRGFALACAAVGGGIELAQALLSTRTASFVDFGADLLGALLAWWAWPLLRERP